LSASGYPFTTNVVTRSSSVAGNNWRGDAVDQLARRLRPGLDGLMPGSGPLVVDGVLTLAGRLGDAAGLRCTLDAAAGAGMPGTPTVEEMRSYLGERTALDEPE
jgi:hypothetical protein